MIKLNPTEEFEININYFDQNKQSEIIGQKSIKMISLKNIVSKNARFNWQGDQNIFIKACDKSKLRVAWASEMTKLTYRHRFYYQQIDVLKLSLSIT